MITIESKPQSSSSISDISAKEESPVVGLSFGELLRGVSKESDTEVVQNGTLILALEKDAPLADTKTASKKDILLGFLKGEQKEDTLPNELNPELSENLSPRELKSLIIDAKNFLRDKIVSSDGFKKSEIAALPKTLKGLTQVAKKFGIDVSTITLEEVKPQTKTTSKIALKIDESALQIPETLEPVKLVPKKLKVDVKQQVVDTNDTVLGDVKRDVKVSATPKELKNTPLFKAQVSSEPTTEQIVNAKINRVDIKTPKIKADDTLKMLLRGDKTSKKEIGFTADLSVTTARVIAPQATTNRSKNLESLLHGDTLDAATSQKVDGLNIPKADSFEVKLNEAKQMTKYLSQDVKTAIEDYKSPFTRIKVQLNPQRLGEVDLTIVQRGKNLHINLSSNNAAINTLALNANDLKVQLTNNGINNATLNFNNNSQSSEQGSFGQQQQNSQHGREAKDQYNYFDNEEKNEEVLNSLEIVVPNYA